MLPASVKRADKCCCVWRHASIWDFALASSPSCAEGKALPHSDARHDLLWSHMEVLFALWPMSWHHKW